jgi:hypothetical protein
VCVCVCNKHLALADGARGDGAVGLVDGIYLSVVPGLV